MLSRFPKWECRALGGLAPFHRRHCVFPAGTGILTGQAGGRRPPGFRILPNGATGGGWTAEALTGSAQECYGVCVDLVTYGKIIGGGMPVGAYGSRQLMELVAPLGPVYQAGTLSGNPMAMAAGLAQLQILQSTFTWSWSCGASTRPPASSRLCSSPRSKAMRGWNRSSRPPGRFSD